MLKKGLHIWKLHHFSQKAYWMRVGLLNRLYRESTYTWTTFNLDDIISFLFSHYFLCLLALIIHELVLGNKGNWESTLVKSKLTWNQIWPVTYPCTTEAASSTLTTKALQFRACNTTLDLLDKILSLSEYLKIHTLSKIWLLFWFNLSISLRWIAFLDETMAIRLKWISSAEYLKKEKV